MINSLSIKNYTLIENVNVNFEFGFSTITGETGAGKSIILDALELVLGKRVDTKIIKNQSEKCIIEVEFCIKKYNLQDFFIQNNIDYEDNTIIRREILPTGKSRNFINDVPTNLDILSELGKKLVDIHSQFQTLKINEKDYQFYILDSIGGNEILLKEYKKNFHKINLLQKEILQLKNDIDISKKSYDYNIFLLEELKSINLEDTNQEDIEKTLQILNSSEEIGTILSKSSNILNDENLGVLKSLNLIKNDLNKFLEIKDISNLYEKIVNLILELKEIHIEIDGFSEKLDFNPLKQKELTEKLDLIYNLQRKHNVKTIKELLDIKNDLELKTLDISILENTLLEKENILDILNSNNIKLAEELYKNRLTAKQLLEKNILNTLKELGMEKSDIDIKISKIDRFNIYGFNEIEFLFSANSGMQKTNITKSVSGGELSRIMLAIKKELSEKINLPTIIFDEIDTGVSGNIAFKMGEIMSFMSNKMQVISITHLPQVASKGDKQYKVLKKNLGEHTVSEIFELKKEERIIEIAKMISGENVTDSALSHAKEMLK